MAGSLSSLSSRRTNNRRKYLCLFLNKIRRTKPIILCVLLVDSRKIMAKTHQFSSTILQICNTLLATYIEPFPGCLAPLRGGQCASLNNFVRISYPSRMCLVESFDIGNNWPEQAHSQEKIMVKRNSDGIIRKSKGHLDKNRT